MPPQGLTVGVPGDDILAGYGRRWAALFDARKRRRVPRARGTAQLIYPEVLRALGRSFPDPSKVRTAITTFAKVGARDRRRGASRLVAVKGAVVGAANGCSRGRSR